MEFRFAVEVLARKRSGVYPVASRVQVVVPQRVVRVRQAKAPDSSTSSVGVPIRSVTMAKKRSSLEPWRRSVWVRGRKPA